MSKYKSLVFSNERKLSIRNNQLMIDGEHSYPLEDINCIVIDNPMISVSASLLGRLSECAVVVFFCDNHHMPSAVLLPAFRHSRHLSILRSQIDASKPLKKQIWQKIIKKKIENQGKCLELSGKTGADELFEMSDLVKSGDTTHVESKAAAYYFRQLFGKYFYRGQDNAINASLNYGYAILRGMISRSLVCHGFEPSIGIWHSSEQNQFNLADDLLEPFRPMVDLFVVQNIDPMSDQMDACVKHKLINLINYDMSVDGESQIIRNCIELLVSDISSMIKGNGDILRLPGLIALSEHNYE